MKPRHDEIYVVDMEGAQQENFELHQTLNGCVSCFNYSKNIQRTYARIRGAVAHVPSERTLVTTPWEETKRTSSAKVIGKETQPKETPCALRKQAPRTNGNLLQIRKPRTSIEKETSQRERKDLAESPVPLLQHGKGHKRNILRARGAKEQQLSKDQEEQAQTSLQECLKYIQSLTQPEKRNHKHRGNNKGQSRAQQQYCKAKDHFQGPSQKMSKLQTPKRVHLHCGKMGSGSDLSRQSPFRTPHTKRLRNAAPHRDRATQVESTNAHKQKERHLGVAG